MKFKSFKKSFKSRGPGASEESSATKTQRFSVGSLRSKNEERKRKTLSTPARLPGIDYDLLAIDVKEVCKEVKDSLSELLLDFEEYEFYSNEIMGHCETLQENAEKITVQLDGRQEDERVLVYEKTEQGDGDIGPVSDIASPGPASELSQNIGVISEEVEPL